MLGYGIGFFHQERISQSESDALSRSLTLASASKHLFLLGTLKDKNSDSANLALSTFLYGDLVSMQVFWEAEKSSLFNKKVCSLITEIEKSGIELEKKGGTEKSARQKTLAELRSSCGISPSSTPR